MKPAGSLPRLVKQGQQLRDGQSLTIAPFLPKSEPRSAQRAPDRQRADQHAATLAANLAGIPLFHLDPGTPGYGLSPLDIAPQATSRWRALFTDAQLDAHLDRLQKDQQADGGWPITWEPPSQAAVAEWRGVVTLQALRTLTSYGRLTAST
jgi:hypothetical protein